MSKIEEAKGFLNEIGMPDKQQSDLCGYTIIALANIKENDSWADATNTWIRIHDIMQFIADNYGVVYAENSRETFRKLALHHFRNAALIVDNGKATNSPNYCYRLTDESIEVIRAIGGKNHQTVIDRFSLYHDRLIDMYSSKKEMTKMPVKINDENFTFSAGKHNELQKAIIEEFAPRFAPNSECLYVGDTIEKDLVNKKERLQAIGFDIT